MGEGSGQWELPGPGYAPGRGDLGRGHSENMGWIPTETCSVFMSYEYLSIVTCLQLGICCAVLQTILLSYVLSLTCRTVSLVFIISLSL